MRNRFVQYHSNNGKWYLIDRLRKLVVLSQKEMIDPSIPISVYNYVNLYYCCDKD